MPYTLWSLGRLLGETDFGFLTSEDRQRRGWLIPTEEGEPLVAVAAGVSVAMEAALQAYDLEEAAADIAAAIDRRDALELELHGPDGGVIPLQRVAIRDTVVLMSVGDTHFEASSSWYESLSAEERHAFDAMIDHEIESGASITEINDIHGMVDEGPGMVRGLPRYELAVTLVDNASIPPR